MTKAEAEAEAERRGTSAREFPTIIMYFCNAAAKVCSQEEWLMVVVTSSASSFDSFIITYMSTSGSGREKRLEGYFARTAPVQIGGHEGGGHYWCGRRHLSGGGITQAQDKHNDGV